MKCLKDIIECADYDKTNDDLENLCDLVDRIISQKWDKDIESVIYDVANDSVDIYNWNIYNSVPKIFDTLEDIIGESGLVGGSLCNTVQYAQTRVNENVLFDNLKPLLHDYLVEQCLSKYFIVEKDEDSVVEYFDINFDDFLDGYNMSDRFDDITDDFYEFMETAAVDLGIDIMYREGLGKSTKELCM